KSGLNSLLLNRFGDTFFVIGLGLTVYLVGSLNFDTLFSLNGYLSTDMLTLILICMLIGCASKISSLLHAACLVIAGVYLLVRCSYIVEYSPIALILILVLGGITTLVSGLIAVVSNDIKKIIALSTMSQLARKYNLSLILKKKNILINKNLSILEKEKIGSIDLNNNHNNNNLKNLDPNYITVFRDAEGYSVSLGFKIDSHIRDSKLLEEIKYLNGLGHIYRRENVRQYSTLNKKSMDVLIDLEEKR
ncbi:NADH:ubiquinone dehydrogenase subunit 5, partial [Pichia californica]